MVRPLKKPKGKSKRVVRSEIAMLKANSKFDPLKNEKIRPKRRLPKTKLNKKKIFNTERHRANLTPDNLNVFYAISVASRRWRDTVREQKLPESERTRSYRPENYPDLIELIPMQHRVKPTAAGQRVIYVLPQRKAMPGWIHAVVEHIRRHKESNWIVVRKPPGLPRARLNGENPNPYIALDSTNVFLEPPSVCTALLSKRGVYVLHCQAFDEYYVGESNDIPARVKAHAEGRGAMKTKKWPFFVRVAPLTPKKNLTLGQWEKVETAAQRMAGRKVTGGGCSQTSQG